MSFRRGYVYRLAAPDRFDDALGRGFDRAVLADRGPVPRGCWVHDAWIVDRSGRRHPGLADTPVPVRLEDVVEAPGQPFTQGSLTS